MNVDAVANSSALGNLAGWLLFACSFLLPLLSLEFRRDGRLALVYWASLLIRQSLALTIGLISGPASDANWFHEWAMTRAREDGLAGLTFRAGGEFYERLLGAAYHVLGASPFLAAELSVFAFSASMLAFMGIVRELDIRRYRPGLLALYALPFSVLFFTSTIIREAYQVLGFVLAAFLALRFRRTGSPVAIALASVSALFMGLLHDALIIFAALFLLLAIIWPIGRQGNRAQRVVRYVVRYAVLVVFIVGGVQLVSRGVGSMALGALVSRKALEYAAEYREGGLRIEARTTYGVRLNTSSPRALAMSVVPVFVYYMFAPFPWQVRAPVDVLGGSEALLRFLLLALALREWWRARGPDRRTREFLLISYFILAGMWALGTINYGTAFRHHVTTNWLLVLLGGPALLHSTLRVVRGIFRTLRVPPRLATG
jgi:hypothetical protein